MRILAVMVTKNESQRYLRSCLEHLSTFVDGIAVYDDRSDDGTRDIVKDYTPYLTERPYDAPGFMDHEARFREQAWWWFEEALAPTTDDWVLCIDADEFLVGDTPDTRSEIERVLGKQNTQAVRIRFPEVFDVRVAPDGTLTHPFHRLDGWWGKIIGHRLFKYKTGGTYNNKKMGCGAEPTYVNELPMLGDRLHGLHMLHLGYAFREDQVRKHRRYTQLHGHGHLDAHVHSIIKPGRLAPWQGPWPTIKLGA